MSFPSPLSLTNLSLPNRLAGTFFPGDGFRDQFLHKLPFEEVQQPTANFQFNRWDSPEKLVPFVERGSEKETMFPTNVDLNSVAFERIGSTLELDTFDSISGRMSDNLAVQAFGIKLSILRSLSLQLIQGTASPNIIGLKSLSASHTVGAAAGATNGGFMTLQDIYTAMYLVAPTEGEVGVGAANYAISNPKTFRELLGVLDAQSRSEGITWVMDKDLGVEVPKFRGLTWLISDSVPLDETKGTGSGLTSVYFVKIGGPTGLRLFYGRDPKIQNVDDFGVHIFPIPIQKAQNIRGLLVEAFYALWAPERAVVSRLDGIKPTQFAL